MKFNPLAKKFVSANIIFLNGFDNLRASPPEKITKGPQIFFYDSKYAH